MTARARTVLPAALVLLLGATLPAAASTGGTAEATGLRATAGEVRLTVETDGVVGGLQSVLDQLTEDPILAGQHMTLAQAGTPEEPSGTDGGTLGPVSVGNVLNVETVTARTDRVENGVLSATSGIDGARVALLGLDVLDVGAVSAVATTHPDRTPTATTAVEHLEVFGTAVTLEAGEPLERSLDLTTDDALEALTQLVPALSTVTGFAGRVAGAGGSIDVRLAGTQEVDDDAGSASAIGLRAEVHLTLDLRLCLPELRGEGCLGEVALRTDARVLDVELGHSRVERPEATSPAAILARYAEPLVVLGCLLVASGVYVGYRRGRWLQGPGTVSTDR